MPMFVLRQNLLTALIVSTVVLLISLSGCAPEEYEIEIEVEPERSGTTHGSGIYQESEEITVEAEPLDGFEFKAWEVDGEVVSTEKSYIFPAEKNKILTAVFEEKLPEKLSLVYETDNDVEGEVIIIKDEQDEVVFEYSFDQFKNWAEENWDNVFEETPAFVEEMPVYPGDLRAAFDQTAALSPDNDRFAFSVHSYFAATFMSFVGVVDLETGETELVDSENRGQVEEITWSPEGEYLAYVLHTAEAERFFLSNDNLDNMTKEFTLNGEDLAQSVQGNGQTHPNFRELTWEDKRLHFTADIALNDTEETVEWSIKPDGTDLRQE